jgi:hypothetical protein
MAVPKRQQTTTNIWVDYLAQIQTGHLQVRYLYATTVNSLSAASQHPNDS